ncbi:hypothetical protein [Moraxella sp. VT-16-12]|uniref:hypothetical protein n=1 Tax=Moraxella sp. VT-16-12 TaxID=2014877 RepID=UPI000B7D3ADC|nr:hypothetical protein [Moraxella sp. VT-16-12]TWV82013.1 hypothetical protein CEW93_006945 [Moraxella sp. VT-16-12]
MYDTQKGMNVVAFTKFITLFNQCYGLGDDELDDLVKIYQDLYQDVPSFQAWLQEQTGEVVDLDSIDETPKMVWLQTLMVHFSPCYFDDWKFDCQALSEYISQYTDEPFVITGEEYAGDMDNLLAKLESSTPYSLLHIWGGNDDVHFWLIDKTHKATLENLAQKLDIWLD